MSPRKSEEDVVINIDLESITDAEERCPLKKK